MFNSIKDAVKDFFKFWKKYPVRMFAYGAACYALGRFVDLPYVPVI